MKNFKRKVSAKKPGLNQSDDQKMKVAQSEHISKKGLKRFHDETEENLQSSTKKMKLMNEFKESQIHKLKPAIKQNLKSNKVFKEAANGQKSLSRGKGKKEKIVEQVEEEESDEEISGNESVDSSDDIHYSLNLSKKSDDSDDDGDDDDDDINDSEDDEDEGEDSDDEEMDDDDIVEAINKKVKTQPKKNLKNNDEDDDDDNSDEDDDNDNSDDDDDDDNSDEDSSDDSSDDEEDAESSSSSSSSEGEDEELETVPWGELTADAPRTEDATSRLALCNMDWNHVKAVDIFVVLNSFKPVGGNIKNVKVYPSDFGLERMKIEEQEGPLKLIGQSKDENAQLINLRKYEMDKLKYYYAVITCDSVDTADAIYKACDGTEFLKSGVVIDLRFIPEDMTFDQKPTSVAKSMPPEGTYEPPDFENKALHCTDVSLTWDETPADRVNAFKCWDEDLDLEEFEARLKDYIAPPSDEDEGDDGDDEEIKKPKKRPLQDTIALYRNLLKDIDDKEKEEEDEKREKEETEKKFLEALGGCTWLTQKNNSAKNDKKSKKDEEEYEDDSGDDDDEEEEESGSEEEDEVDDEEEEEEEVKLPVKGKKISNRKLVKMKIKEKKKQKMSDIALPTTQADRFKKLMDNKDFALDEKVADKTTKLKQRRIFSDMKKKHGR